MLRSSASTLSYALGMLTTVTAAEHVLESFNFDHDFVAILLSIAATFRNPVHLSFFEHCLEVCSRRNFCVFDQTAPVLMPPPGPNLQKMLQALSRILLQLQVNALAQNDSYSEILSLIIKTALAATQNAFNAHKDYSGSKSKLISQFIKIFSAIRQKLRSYAKD